MTGGTLPSAAAAGGAHDLAARDRKRSGPLRPRCNGEPGCRAEGARPDFGDLGSKSKLARNGEGGKKIKSNEFFLFYKNNQTNEFKHEFEFKHCKSNALTCMQQ
jgi:hypothetical protein